MSGVLLFFLALMVFCVLAVIILIVATENENKKEQKRREKAFKCKQAVKNGECPKDCIICEWGSYEN